MFLINRKSGNHGIRTAGVVVVVGCTPARGGIDYERRHKKGKKDTQDHVRKKITSLRLSAPLGTIALLVPTE